MLKILFLLLLIYRNRQQKKRDNVCVLHTWLVNNIISNFFLHILISTFYFIAILYTIHWASCKTSMSVQRCLYVIIITIPTTCHLIYNLRYNLHGTLNLFSSIDKKIYWLFTHADNIFVTWTLNYVPSD